MTTFDVFQTTRDSGGCNSEYVGVVEAHSIEEARRVAESTYGVNCRDHDQIVNGRVQSVPIAWVCRMCDAV